MVTFSYLLMTLLGFSGVFLIALILLQRGRGGGLAGAFGGMGGQSAFGTKAGDVFTRITIGVASAWILLCAGSVLALHYSSGIRFDPGQIIEPVKKAAPKDLDDAKNDVKNDADEKDAKEPELPSPAKPDAPDTKDAPSKADDKNQPEVKKTGDEDQPKEPVKPENPESKPD